VTASGDEASDRGGAGRWRVSHAVAAFGAGVLAAVAASAAVWSGGVSVFEAFAVVGATQTLVTIAAVSWFARTPGREPLGLRPAASDAAFLFIGAALAVAVSWVTYLVVQVVFGGEAPVQSVVLVADEARGTAARVAVVVVTVLLAPVAEEIVFRGVLLRALQHRFSARVTFFTTAAAFGLAHLALDPDAAVAVPALFVMGLVLAAQVQRRGRLSPAVFTHMGFNLLGVVALLAS